MQFRRVVQRKILAQFADAHHKIKRQRRNPPIRRGFAVWQAGLQ
jgi:hypothetical protein